MTEVTRILNAIEQGDPSASEQLLPLVYEELRVLAARRLANERPGQMLQATALVHEAYLRLVGKDDGQSWDNRGHFFAAAARAMRRILVDNARRRNRINHGGGKQQVPLTEAHLASDAPPDELIMVDEAIDRLEAEDPQAAELVSLCYFGGMELEQAAEFVGISRATAYRHWAYAKAWLFRQTRLEE